MTKKPYVSQVRTAATEQKRERVIETAQRLLRREGIATFSLESVAKAAGVARLTVYNYFGSRKGLLEAAFDEIARRGGLSRLGAAIANPNGREGIEQLIEIFCAFWDSDPAVASLHAAMAIDAEFAQALKARNERRRNNLTILVDRVVQGRGAKVARDEVIDLIFGLTSCAMYLHLKAGRSHKRVAKIIQAASRDAIDRLLRISPNWRDGRE